MDDFICEIMTSDDSLTPEHIVEQNKIISTQKKLRRTEDLFQILSTSDRVATESNIKPNALRKTRICKNLFLPKILDTQKVSTETGLSGIRNRESLLKKKVALKLVQRKIEAKVLKFKKPKHITTNKFKMETVAESPCIARVLESPHNARLSQSLCNTSVLENPHIARVPERPCYGRRFENRNTLTPIVLMNDVSQITEMHNSFEKNKAPEFKKQLYIPLVPLEKTNLLDKHQKMKLLQDVSKLNLSFGHTSLHRKHKLVTENNIFTLEHNYQPCKEILQHFDRPCKVILERLPLEQMQRITSPSKFSFFTRNTGDSTMNHFLPSSTSSPFGSPRLSTSTSKNNDLKESLLSSSDVQNATYSINNFSATKVTFRRSKPSLQTKVIKTENSTFANSPVPNIVISLQESGLNLIDSNSTSHNTTRIDYLKPPPQIPKSALKSNKPNTVSNGAVRHVTFSNTSIIIIDDDSEGSSPGTPHRKSLATLTPTNFRIDDSDEENSNTSRINKHVTVRRTPFYAKTALNNTYSLSPLSTSSNSSPRSFLRKSSNSSRKSSKVKKVPNFAVLHKKMFDKMLDIEEYSLQKQERAKLLLSGQKPKTASLSSSRSRSSHTDSSAKTESEPKVRVLNGLTRFGFKSKTVGNSTKNEQIAAAVNKTKPLKSSSQIMRMEIKGVRSNRRFDLLMKMRLNKNSS